jgi:hypothetical protein
MQQAAGHPSYLQAAYRVRAWTRRRGGGGLRWNTDKEYCTPSRGNGINRTYLVRSKRGKNVNKSTMDKKGKESCQSSGAKSGNANITNDKNRLFNYRRRQGRVECGQLRGKNRVTNK